MLLAIAPPIEAPCKVSPVLLLLRFPPPRPTQTPLSPPDLNTLFSFLNIFFPLFPVGSPEPVDLGEPGGVATEPTLCPSSYSTGSFACTAKSHVGSFCSQTTKSQKQVAVYGGLYKVQRLHKHKLKF